MATKRFEVGARVHEPTYGLGSVISVEDAFTRIQFDDNTIRKFLTSLARLEPSNEPAPPARPQRSRKRKTGTASAAKATKATKAKKSSAPAEVDLDADAGGDVPGDPDLDGDLVD